MLLPNLKNIGLIDITEVYAISNEDITRQEGEHVNKLNELRNARDKDVKEQVLATLLCG